MPIPSLWLERFHNKTKLDGALRFIKQHRPVISHVTFNLDSDDEVLALVKTVLDECKPLSVRMADRSESKVGLDYVLQCGTSVRELTVEMVSRR